MLLSINEKDGLPPIELDKMDKGETWYWIYPIGESVRDEFALDECMKRHGIRHFWEDRLKEARARAAQRKKNDETTPDGV